MNTKAQHTAASAPAFGLRLRISERRLLMAAGDLLAVMAATLIALRIWAWVGGRQFNLGFIASQMHWLVILGGLWLGLAAANDFYNLNLNARWGRSQLRLLEIKLQLLLVYLLIFFFSPRDALPRLFILYYAGASYVLIALWRSARPFAIGWQPLRRRAVVVGVGWEAQALLEAIRKAAPDDYEIVAFVDEGTRLEGADVVVEAEVIGSARDLPHIVEALGADEVILSNTGAVAGDLFTSIMACYERGIPVTSMPLLYERLTGMVPVEHVRGHWNVVLPIEGRATFDHYALLKRALDLCVSAVGLLLFGLMLPPLALLIVLDSPGPVFFSQERVGKAGHVFRITKLRTMIPDAEAKSGPLWAVQGDPRVTRVGRFLRRSRIDELPQLWNIFRGEMSLVGPRPERPFFVEQLQQSIPLYRARLAVTPGVTGWAQVNYGYGSSTEDALNKLKFDLYYIRHRSIGLDILIILRTVGRVLKLQGQ